MKWFMNFTLALTLSFAFGINTVQAGVNDAVDTAFDVKPLTKQDQSLIKKYMKSWKNDIPEVQKAVNVALLKLARQENLNKLSKQELMALNLLPPTKEYIATIAAKYNVAYNKKVKGNDMFYGAEGEPLYPENEGFIGVPDVEALVPDKYLLDRFGAPRGRFFAFYGADFGSRALNKYDREDFKTGRKEYHIYKVVKPISGVLLGTAAPWFGEKGGCIQGMVQGSIAKYLKNNEYLVEVLDRNEADRLAEAFKTK